MNSALFVSLATALSASLAIAQVTIPPHSAIYNGFTRGYTFTAQTQFLINQLELPLDALQAGDTAGFLVRVNGAIVFRSVGNATAAIPANIIVNNGDVVDVMGNWSPAVTGNFSAHNSYTASMTNFATSILGVPHTIQRSGWQWDIGDPNYLSGTFLPPTTGQMGRVFIYAVPLAGLFPNFTADVTGGVTPLTVNFTDQSYSSAPGGVLAWAWDFDGDTVIDSTLQNPTWVYTTCGSYNVSLTVFDSTFPPATLTRTAYINTDRIAANFTSQVIGPLLVQFTDTSSMPATSWSWDLDGDLVPDSTVQNPVWIYPNANPVNVTLTVTRLCAPPSTITKSIVPLQTLSHNVAPNNGLGTGASVYFDLDVTNPAGVNLNAMDVFGSVVNVPFTVDLYVKPGTHRTFEGTAALWVKAGTASGTSASANTLPSHAAFPQALYLPPGLHGIKLHYIGTGPRYRNITATTTVSNGDLAMTLGVSRGSTVANPWGGSNIDLRAWSGTLYYGTHNITGLAGFGSFGPGCAGSLGVSHLAANLPQLGSTLNLSVNNLPQSIAIMMIGFSNTFSPFGPLPLDVTTFGAPGCFGRVSPDVTVLLLGAGNTAVWPFAIPNDPTLSGLRLFNQAFVLDPGFNTLGAVLSDAAAFIIGT